MGPLYFSSRHSISIIFTPMALSILLSFSHTMHPCFSFINIILSLSPIFMLIFILLSLSHTIPMFFRTYYSVSTILLLFYHTLRFVFFIYANFTFYTDLHFITHRVLVFLFSPIALAYLIYHIAK